MTLSSDVVKVLSFVLPLIHLCGIFLAVHAVWFSRTPQAAIAWAVSLITMPYFTIPCYLVFGRSRFHGYVKARRSQQHELKQIAKDLASKADALHVIPYTKALPSFRVLENLARLPFTQGVSAELLVDGEATFQAIFEAIEAAKRYVLVQFFIVRDDKLGKKLSALLRKKAAQGVPCLFLYDEMGCSTTKKHYWKELTEAGVEVRPFNSRGVGWRTRFQINFRNHRKIVIADGEKAFVGGHNVGDEYLGEGPLGAWRDTHVAVKGPVVAPIQLSFVEDWYWATGRVPELEWHLAEHPQGDVVSLAIATGPADEIDVCSLMFTQLIAAARQRLWIATPYFVPDPSVMAALKLAVLRGVDVRILIPSKPDHYLTHLASFAFIEEVEGVGVKFYRYEAGFPHQKVILVDNDGAAVGTANLDNRSLRLNFEITLLFAGDRLANDVREMLEADFARSVLVPKAELAKKTLPFQIAVRLARLLSPIL